jgi:transcription elongation factor Elf1
VRIKVKTKTDKLQCSHCQSRQVKKSGIKERLFRGVPIGSSHVDIIFKVQRLKCKSCGRIGSTANLVENQIYLKVKIYVILIIRFNIL